MKTQTGFKGWLKKWRKHNRLPGRLYLRRLNSENAAVYLEFAFAFSMIMMFTLFLFEMAFYWDKTVMANHAAFTISRIAKVQELEKGKIEYPKLDDLKIVSGNTCDVVVASIFMGSATRLPFKEKGKGKAKFPTILGWLRGSLGYTAYLEEGYKMAFERITIDGVLTTEVISLNTKFKHPTAKDGKVDQTPHVAKVSLNYPVTMLWPYFQWGKSKEPLIDPIPGMPPNTMLVKGRYAMLIEPEKKLKKTKDK